MGQKILTNELGYSFEVDEVLTNFVKNKQICGGKLYSAIEDFSVVEVTKDGIFQTFLLYDDKSGAPVRDLGGFEQAMCYLDMLKLSKTYEKT